MNAATVRPYIAADTAAHLSAADAMVTRAVEVGLPAPVYVNVIPNGASLSLRTLEDLTDWSLWVEEPIDSQTVLTGAVVYKVPAVYDGVPVDLLCIKASS